MIQPSLLAEPDPPSGSREDRARTAVCHVCGDPETGEIFADDSGTPLHRASLHHAERA